MKDGAGILLAGLAGKAGATGPGATGGSWPGESWGENTCRNGTDVVLHEKVKIDTIMAVDAYGLFMRV